MLEKQRKISETAWSVQVPIQRETVSNIKLNLGMLANPYNLSTRESDLSEFENNLLYIVSKRLPGLHSETLSFKKAPGIG